MASRVRVCTRTMQVLGSTLPGGHGATSGSGRPSDAAAAAGLMEAALPAAKASLLTASTVHRRQHAFAALHSAYLHAGAAAQVAEDGRQCERQAEAFGGGGGATSARLHPADPGGAGGRSPPGSGPDQRPASYRRLLELGVIPGVGLGSSGSGEGSGPEAAGGAAALVCISRLASPRAGRQVLLAEEADKARPALQLQHTAAAADGRDGQLGAYGLVLRRPQSAVARAYEAAVQQQQSLTDQGQARPPRRAPPQRPYSAMPGGPSSQAAALAVGPVQLLLEGCASPRRGAVADADGAAAVDAGGSLPQQLQHQGGTSPPRALGLLTQAGVKVSAQPASVVMCDLHMGARHPSRMCCRHADMVQFLAIPSYKVHAMCCSSASRVCAPSLSCPTSRHPPLAPALGLRTR